MGRNWSKVMLSHTSRLSATWYNFHQCYLTKKSFSMFNNAVAYMQIRFWQIKSANLAQEVDQAIPLEKFGR